DRYLLERVTDQQYAILNGQLRHVPGGVDEYLQLSKQLDAQPQKTRPDQAVGSSQVNDDGKLTGAQRRDAQREVSSIERRLNRLAEQMEQLHEQMAAHDQTDYVGLQEFTTQLRE